MARVPPVVQVPAEAFEGTRSLAELEARLPRRPLSQAEAEARATVAVLGCGPDLCYPPEHAALLERIVERGAVATELAPGTPPRAWHFPLRNRILGGMVSGVVVVQAEPKSGALVTARHALEENRQVMAVPGDVFDPRSVGPHRLLREGAALVDG